MLHALVRWLFLGVLVAAATLVSAHVQMPLPALDTAVVGCACAPEQQQIVVQSAQPQSLDPQRAGSEQEIAIARMLWRGLYELEATPDGGVRAVPAMAAGEPSVNGNVYTVELKPGLKWSDGQPLTATDFEYGI